MKLQYTLRRTNDERRSVVSDDVPDERQSRVGQSREVKEEKEDKPGRFNLALRPLANDWIFL